MTSTDPLAALREEIAAAIYNDLRRQVEVGDAFGGVMVTPAVGSDEFRGVAYVDGEVNLGSAADAVIAALGIRVETVAFANGPLNGFKGGPYDGCKNGANHRYVTEWRTDV